MVDKATFGEGFYISAPFTPLSFTPSPAPQQPNTPPPPPPCYYFEDEVSNGLLKDDATILEERYRYRTSSLSYSSSSSSNSNHPHPSLPPSSTPKHIKERQSRITKSVKSQTQWTRALDAVQEHFSSHVTIDRTSHKLPPSICALKAIAKHNWVLYKKRECERRKRIRRKIEKEKKNERNGKPSNILMAMVDSCEVCKRLYVTVNLFWGVTLCDSCYFTPGVINDIMKTRLDSADQKMNYTPENIVKEVIKYRKDFFASNKNYFELEHEQERKIEDDDDDVCTSSPFPKQQAIQAIEKMEVSEAIISGKDEFLFEEEEEESSDNNSNNNDNNDDDDDQLLLPSPIPDLPSPSPPPSSSYSYNASSTITNTIQSSQDVFDLFRGMDSQAYIQSVTDFDDIDLDNGDFYDSPYSFTFESTKANPPKK